MASPASLAIVPVQQSVATREESKMTSINNMIYQVFTEFTSEDWENVKEADFTSPIKKRQNAKVLVFNDFTYHTLIT